MTQRLSCPACGRDNDAGQRFCTECGASLLRTCPSCSATNSVAARFCGECGNALEETAHEGVDGRPGSIPTAEERRLATVVFADISGFTHLSEEMDPEDVQALVKSCMARLGAIVERYGGSVDKVIGDALMAVFGAPVAHGDDAERAVRAALEMQQCAVENAAEFGSLSLRVGVNTGEVMFAPVEAGGKATVTGDVVNTAQRLQAEAPPVGVLVGEETHRATAGAVRYEEVTPVVAKGKSRPLPAWVAVEAIALPAERPARDAPLVGRDSETAMLRTIWERTASEARSHLVTVLGPPGVGKTRLVAELAEHVEAGGGRSLRGRSLPYGESSGYAAFGHQVKAFAGIFETDAAPVARSKLEHALEALLPTDGAADIAAHLAALIGLGDEGSDKAVLFLAARRFVEALARDTPTLLVFEDLHWADPSLLDLVETVAGRIRGVPLLVAALARPELHELRPSWGGGLAAATTFPLEPLGREAAKELAERLLVQRVAAVDEDVVARLSQTAEGNPLFIEELVASIAERTPDAAERLPTTVKGIIAARIDALSPEERSVVFDASVIGKVFWRGALAHLRGDSERLDAVLDSLEARDLIRREESSRIRGDEEFSFKHMLIREVAYATLPRAVRPERHAAVARFIEAAAGDRLSESAVVLAYHWEQAGNREKTLEHTLAAADQSRRSGATRESVAFYDRALGLLPEEEADARRDVRIRLAVTRVEGGDFKEAMPELDALLEEVQGRERYELLDNRFKVAFWGQTDAELSRHLAEEGRKLAEQLGEEELIAVSLAREAAAIAMGGEIEEALAVEAGALDRWIAGSQRRDLAETLEWHSLHQYWVGNYRKGVEPARSAIEVGETVHSLAGIVNGRADLGLLLTGLGRHEEAFAVYAEAVRHGRELELEPRFTARVMNMWAGALRELYDTAAARRLNEEAIEIAGRVNFAGAQVSGLIDVLQLDLLEGNVGEAEVAWPGLWDAAAATKGWHQWLWTTRISAARADLELAAGRTEPAVEAARRALDEAARWGRLKYVVAARTALAEGLLALGRATEAVDASRQTLREAEKLEHPPSIWRAASVLSRALAAVGDDAGAEKAFAGCRDSIEAFAGGLSAERRETFLGAPQLAPFLEPARSA